MREQFGFLTRIRLSKTKSHEIKVSVKFIANHDQNHCNLAPAITQFGVYCRSQNDFNVIFCTSEGQSVFYNNYVRLKSGGYVDHNQHHCNSTPAEALFEVNC